MDPYLDNDYQNALDFLYSHINYSLTRNLRYSPEKFNLERMYELLRKLGNPQLDYATVHVAGTKGKGSVCALIASVLQTAGYKTGFYSSPHMRDFTERIRFNNCTIPKKDLARLVNEIEPVVTSIRNLTTFEITTAIAFLYFSRMKSEIAVVEVGLGGRLDATNVIIPIVSVITPISLDHVKILGNTVEKIAMEKSGIIKRDQPVVVAPQRESVLKIIEEIANKKHAHIIEIDRDFSYKQLFHSFEYQTFLLSHSNDKEKDVFGEEIDSNKYIELSIPLLGKHQVQNAALAFGALEVIKENGFRISDNAVKNGFMNTVWRGRFEILSQNPFIIVDSAHNVDSTKKLINAIDDYFANYEVILIFGASEDKDIDGMLKLLSKRAKVIIFTKSSHPRAIEPVEIRDIAIKYKDNIFTTINCKEALELAMKSIKKNQLILVTGSIFVVAAISNLWDKRKKLIVKT